MWTSKLQQEPSGSVVKLSTFRMFPQGSYVSLLGGTYMFSSVSSLPAGTVLLDPWVLTVTLSAPDLQPPPPPKHSNNGHTVSSIDITGQEEPGKPGPGAEG
ncbi:hypothetical protein CRENBAI_000595 [Crenichthys baileyi]|uniref:Uncharacterized protein n=1 Tax=Crenichthys baileyi TaxID=28760 RepID=A0AAV9RWF3_9TELE